MVKNSLRSGVVFGIGRDSKGIMPLPGITLNRGRRKFTSPFGMDSR